MDHILFSRWDRTARWIELRIPVAETGLVLAKPFQPGNVVGAFMNLAVTANDVQRTYDELAARGVESASRRRMNRGVRAPSSTIRRQQLRATR